MIPKHRKPTPPGEILLKEFLEPMGISQVELAKKMEVPVQRVNTIINGKRDITADTAILLAKVFGTSDEFWMNLQTASDIFKAREKYNVKHAVRAKNSRTVRAVKKPV